MVDGSSSLMAEGSNSQSSLTKTHRELLDKEFIPLESKDSSASITKRKALVGRIILAKAFNRFFVINMLKK